VWGPVGAEDALENSFGVACGDGSAYDSIPIAAY
jgi:hypothetical protein